MSTHLEDLDREWREGTDLWLSAECPEAWAELKRIDTELEALHQRRHETVALLPKVKGMSIMPMVYFEARETGDPIETVKQAIIARLMQHRAERAIGRANKP